MEFVAIIPARYASTRFPGKPLAILGDKPVIQRVYEQAKKVFDNVCGSSRSPDKDRFLLQTEYSLCPHQK